MSIKLQFFRSEYLGDIEKHFETFVSVNGITEDKIIKIYSGFIENKNGDLVTTLTLVYKDTTNQG